MVPGAKFFKKLWVGLKWFGGILLALLAGLGAIWVANKLRQAVKGVPANRIKWAKVTGKKDQIILYVDQEPESWETVNLPPGMTSDEVKNVGTDDSQHHIIVEAQHEKVDRHDADVIDNNALDDLFPGDSGGSSPGGSD